MTDERRVAEEMRVQMAVIERALQLRSVDIGLGGSTTELTALARVNAQLEAAHAELHGLHAQIKQRRAALERDSQLFQQMQQHQQHAEAQLAIAEQQAQVARTEIDALRRALADSTRQAARSAANAATAERERGELRRALLQKSTSLEESQAICQSLRSDYAHEKLAHDSVLESLRLERDMRVSLATELEKTKGWCSECARGM